MAIMMVTSWDETKGKIKHTYDEIESAYQKHVVSAADKAKERPLLNAAIKLSLSAIPIVGPNLRDSYDNIGGGTKSEEDKTKQILEFLKKLEQQNKEQFDRLAEDLEANRDVIIDAINGNKIALTDLISKSSTEILEAVGKVREDTSEIRVRVERMVALLEKEFPTDHEVDPFIGFVNEAATNRVLAQRDYQNCAKAFSEICNMIAGANDRTLRWFYLLCNFNFESSDARDNFHNLMYNYDRLRKKAIDY